MEWGNLFGYPAGLTVAFDSKQERIKTENMKRVEARVSEHYKKRVQARARKLKISQAELLRRILRQAFK